MFDPELSAPLKEAGIVNGTVWADLEPDGESELILATEWGPIRVFETGTGKLVETTAALGLDLFTGRWNGIATGDFDRDGRGEIVASNWGRNTQYQRHRAKPIRLYYGDWNGDGRSDLLESYFDPNRGEYVPFATLDRLRLVVAKQRHPGFRHASAPLAARVVWPGGRVTEKEIPKEAGELEIAL